MNPWKILGVNRQSEEPEIRNAYLDLARKYHPDVKKGNNDKMAEVNAAYHLLKDKKRCSTFIKDIIIWNEECSNCRGVGAIFKQKGLTGRVPTTCKTCSGAGVLFKEKVK